METQDLSNTMADDDWLKVSFYSFFFEISQNRYVSACKRRRETCSIKFCNNLLIFPMSRGKAFKLKQKAFSFSSTCRKFIVSNCSSETAIDNARKDCKIIKKEGITKIKREKFILNSTWS